MTNEQVITRIKHNQMYKDDRETADYIIKALEQQPSDDCVSRQAVRTAIMSCETFYEDRLETFIEDTTDLEIKINDLPSVTPTHGTCMDCKHNRPNSYARTMFSCENGHRFKLRDCENFYCADFEKRGAENE